MSYRTDPFGEITQQEGESVNRQVFTGHEHDTETGLIYMKARFYDPDVGRFLSQDTYLGENNTPPSLHRYLYAYSNPTIYVDPNGYCVISPVEGSILGCVWDWATGKVSDTAHDVVNYSLEQTQKQGDFIDLGGPTATLNPWHIIGFSGQVVENNPDTVLLVPPLAKPLIKARKANKATDEARQAAAKSQNTTKATATVEKPILQGDSYTAIPKNSVVDKEVILDTNAVKGYKEAQKQLKTGETPVVTKQTIKELEELRDRPSAKAFTQDTVDFANTLKVVEDVDTLDSVKSVRKRQMELTETKKLKKQGIEQEFPDANKVQGLEGDGIIGSTVLETKRPIITDDNDFAHTLESLGAEVRKTK